jgi:hypothetical protein
LQNPIDMSVHIIPGETTAKPYPWDVESWIDNAARSPAYVYAALDALRLTNRPQLTADLERDMGAVTLAFPEDFAPFSHDRPRSPAGRFAMLRAITSWLRGLKVVDEDETVVTVEVPLCVFNSPAETGAKTTFSESKTMQGTTGWKIDVLGTGFGSDVSVSVIQTNTFTASETERKLIFAPIRMRVVKVCLYKRGEFQSFFLRSEATETTERDANGIRSVDAAEWQTFVGDGNVIERFDLSRDQGRGIATYERAYEISGSFEVKLGFSAFDLKSEVTAKCAAKQSASVKFELPAGRLYEVRRPATVSGVYF